MRAVVQVRSDINMDGDIADTLEMLNVHTVNHCTLVPETDAYEGMITKVNDYVAHGEPSAEVLATLLRHRGEPATGDTDVDDEWVAEHTAYGDVDELAAALIGEETTLQDAGLAPSLRLHPPRGGHDGLKKPVASGGQIGVHSTEEIDRLLEAMR
jgi:LSU ribosomal protein L30P